RIHTYIDDLDKSEGEKMRLRALVPALHDAKTQLYTELIGDGRCPLRPGIARLLDEARDAGVQLAIASTTTSANVDSLLARHLGASGRYRFAVIACADAVERKKPAPDIYRLVLAMLGHSADQCVAFEDSENGLRAAKAAGLFTVVTPSPWTQGGDFDDADLVLPHLGDRERPLPMPHAARLGAPWLGLNELVARQQAVVNHASAASAYHSQR
ncbi:MAG TPA: HAD-IA family hydrolase, partial [Casimicrobiaceae bacterium]|nr:HAD-IA family hydrolase [Casimicrobiaceae bacterium]